MQVEFSSSLEFFGIVEFLEPGFVAAWFYWSLGGLVRLSDTITNPL